MGFYKNIFFQVLHVHLEFSFEGLVAFGNCVLEHGRDVLLGSCSLGCGGCILQSLDCTCEHRVQVVEAKFLQGLLRRRGRAIQASWMRIESHILSLQLVGFFDNFFVDRRIEEFNVGNSYM
jgi:hypothetical protein